MALPLTSWIGIAFRTLGTRLRAAKLEACVILLANLLCFPAVSLADDTSTLNNAAGSAPQVQPVSEAGQANAPAQLITPTKLPASERRPDRITWRQANADSIDPQKRFSQAANTLKQVPPTADGVNQATTQSPSPNWQSVDPKTINLQRLPEPGIAQSPSPHPSQLARPASLSPQRQPIDDRMVVPANAVTREQPSDQQVMPAGGNQAQPTNVTRVGYVTSGDEPAKPKVISSIADGNNDAIEYVPEPPKVESGANDIPPPPRFRDSTVRRKLDAAHKPARTIDASMVNVTSNRQAVVDQKVVKTAHEESSRSSIADDIAAPSIVSSSSPATTNISQSNDPAVDPILATARVREPQPDPAPSSTVQKSTDGQSASQQTVVAKQSNDTLLSPDANAAQSGQSASNLPEPTSLEPIAPANQLTAPDVDALEPKPDANEADAIPDPAKVTSRKQRTAGDNIMAPGSGLSGTRRVRIFPRGSQRFDAQTYPQTADGYTEILISGGVNVIVEEVDTGRGADLLADRAVVRFKRSDDRDAGFRNDEFQQEKRDPFDVYLEGNVIVQYGNLRDPKQGQYVKLTAKQAFYDARTESSYVLNGAIETVDDRLQIPIYMTAGEIRQIAPGSYFAQDAIFSGSPYRGLPSYSFRGRRVYFEQVKDPIRNPFTGQQAIDSETGTPLERQRQFVTARQNRFFLNETPVFYFPYLRVDAEDPLGPIERFRVGGTSRLGANATVSLDVWQLIGLDYLKIADRTNWLLDVGYFAKRGFALGNRFNYFGDEFLGLEGKNFGQIDSYWINDHGTDFLGPGRTNVVPDRTNRGRFQWQHRQDFDNDMTLIAEGSYLSDRNFLEFYREAEYDVGGDQNNLIYLKQQRDQWAWSLMAQQRVHSFLPQNSQLPRLDGYLLGLSLFEDRLTYYSHSSLGYYSVLPPDQYKLKADRFVDTARLDSRHELNLPVELGDWQVTPFAIGQFTGYTDTETVNGLGRLYAAGGVRTSLPFWKLFAGVESDLLNLSGLAHKVSLDVDYIYAHATSRPGALPYIDQVDDDTSDLVRRQNTIRSYGGVISPVRDPYRFANRRGVWWLPEALDDMQQIRGGIKQRWQTKRGPVGDQHIIDWLVIDVGASYFPQANRDNFKEDIGLVDMSMEWNVGDRTSVNASYFWEPFENRAEFLGGINLMRPPRTMVAIMFSHYKTTVLESNLVAATMSYRFSEKYAAASSIGFDVGQGNASGYSLGISRVGLDFVYTLGMNYNVGRNDFGFFFEFFPRVIARTNYGRSNLNTLPFGVSPTDDTLPKIDQRMNLQNSNLFFNNRF